MLNTFYGLNALACFRRLRGAQILLRVLRFAPLTLYVSCKVVCHAEVECRWLEFNLPPRKLSPFVPRRVDPTHEIEVINVVECAEVRALDVKWRLVGHFGVIMTRTCWTYPFGGFD